MFHILHTSKYPPFALLTALQSLGLLSVSFMMLSPEMVFISQVCLVRVHLWNFLPSKWGWDHQKRQSIITLRTESQSVRKITKTLNVSPTGLGGLL